MKPFKDEHPKKTIEKAKKILKNLEFSLIEKHYFKSKNLHACSLETRNVGVNKLKTYGKGSTYLYALASAYGEFLERLQNGILIKNTKPATEKEINKNKNTSFKNKLVKKNAVLKYNFDPREFIIPSEEYIEKNLLFLKKILLLDNLKLIKKFIIQDLGFNSFVCVPFYDKKNNIEIFIPIELLLHISGSNGMCAGNSTGEAIIQGLCEILERYALKQVYFRQLTPPTISIENFKANSKAVKIINEMKENGLDVIIKDFSLGQNLPVIGILIIDKLNYKYNIKVGSDLVPQRALERCLTEFYQSPNSPNLLPLEKINNCSQKNRFSSIVNYNNICSFSSGHWHKSILNHKFSYNFNGLNKSLGKNHKEDLIHLNHLIKKLNSSIYIRDTSFLGFKSFYIYIPQISHYKGEIIEDYLLYNDFWKNQKTFISIKKSSDNELQNLINSIVKWQKINPRFWIDVVKPSFSYHTSEELKNLNLNLFLSFAYYKLGNLNSSIKYLSSFLDEYGKNDRTSFLYFYACNDYFKLKKELASLIDITITLTLIYPEDLVQEVLKDLQNSENIFHFFKLPTCYECNFCEISEYCSYFDLMNKVNNIQKIQSENKINQLDLKKYLTFEEQNSYNNVK